MRKAGDVCFAEVHHDDDGAVGMVDYTNYEDMEYAIRKLDGTEFRNPFTRSHIRVMSYNASPRRAGGQDRSRSRSRSPRSNQRSIPKSRSPSPARLSRPRSRSRSN